jgi:hypothetical protein
MTIALFLFKLALALAATAMLGYMLVVAPAVLSETDLSSVLLKPLGDVQRLALTPSDRPSVGGGPLGDEQRLALTPSDRPSQSSPNVQKESGLPSKEPEARKRSDADGKPIGGQQSKGQAGKDSKQLQDEAAKQK